MCWWLPMSGAGARVGRGQVTQLCHAGGNTARDWVEAFRRGIRRLRYDIPCTHLCWTWKVTVNTHTTLPCLIYQLLHCIVDCADIPPSTMVALLRSDVVAWRGWAGVGQGWRGTAKVLRWQWVHCVHRLAPAVVRWYYPVIWRNIHHLFSQSAPSNTLHSATCILLDFWLLIDTSWQKYFQWASI